MTVPKYTGEYGWIESVSHTAHALVFKVKEYNAPLDWKTLLADICQCERGASLRSVTTSDDEVSRVEFTSRSCMLVSIAYVSLRRLSRFPTQCTSTADDKVLDELPVYGPDFSGPAYASTLPSIKVPDLSNLNEVFDISKNTQEFVQAAALYAFMEHTKVQLPGTYELVNEYAKQLTELTSKYAGKIEKLGEHGEGEAASLAILSPTVMVLDLWLVALAEDARQQYFLTGAPGANENKEPNNG